MTYPVPDNPEYDRLDDDPAIVECPDCDGAGEVPIRPVSIETNDVILWLDVETCRRCHGRGEIPNPDLPESEQEAIRQAKGW